MIKCKCVYGWWRWLNESFEDYTVKSWKSSQWVILGHFESSVVILCSNKQESLMEFGDEYHEGCDSIPWKWLPFLKSMEHLEKQRKRNPLLRIMCGLWTSAHTEPFGERTKNAERSTISWIEQVSNSKIRTKEENENNKKTYTRRAWLLWICQASPYLDFFLQTLVFFCNFEEKETWAKTWQIIVIASVTKRELGEGRL